MNAILRELFNLANAGNYPEKNSFYLLKERLLERFADFQGWDLQQITQVCWSCDGTGTHYHPGDCRKCGGDGIFRIKYIRLSRWYLSGWIYHTPQREIASPYQTVFLTNDDCVEILDFEPGRFPFQVIQGKITHPPTNNRAARLAFLILHILYAPWQNSWRIIQNGFRPRWLFPWYWKCQMNRMKIALNQDDIPF